MGFREVQAVHNLDKTEFTAGEVAVAYSLAAMMKNNDAKEVPISDISDKSGLSSASVRRSLKTLEAAGFVSIRSTGRALSIRLTLPC